MNGITDIKRVMNVYDVRMPAVVRFRGLNPWFRRGTTTWEYCILGMLMDWGIIQTYIFALCIIVLKSHARISEYD